MHMHAAYFKKYSALVYSYNARVSLALMGLNGAEKIFE